MRREISELDFMVIGLPRSGTTWAANWLTTDDTHCVHDPLYHTHYTDWDINARFKHAEREFTGVACTGVWRWDGWLNQHPARKVVLHRSVREVNDSLRRLGLPEVERSADSQLDKVQGLHVNYRTLFDEDGARRIWKYLLPGRPFNRARHEELVAIRMQPDFMRVVVDPEVTRRLMREVEEACG